MKQKTEKMSGAVRRVIAMVFLGVAMCGGVVSMAQPVWADACAGSGIIDCSNGETLAADDECGNAGILGFRPWYKGLVVRSNGKCEVGRPVGGDDAMTVYVWTIILNVLIDIFSAVGFLAVGFIVYGGFFYIQSGGDPGKVAKGKKIIMAAVIGLIIVILASVISNTVITILQQALK